MYKGSLLWYYSKLNYVFTAHVLTEECEGETPMIPSDIMDYSISQTKKTDLSTTLKVLASPSQSVESIPGSDHSTDPVIRCVMVFYKRKYCVECTLYMLWFVIL